MTLKMRCTLAVAACAVAALAAGSAAATTMVYRSVDELFEISDLVVRATAVGHQTFWSEEGTMLTDWTFTVDEVLAGEPRSLITVRQMGGEIDELRLHIPGDGRFSDGDHVVLFLVSEDDLFYLTAMGQAVMTVSLQGGLGVPGVPGEVGPVSSVAPIDATVIRDLSDLVFYAVQDGEARLYSLEEAEIYTLEILREKGAALERGGER